MPDLADRHLVLVGLMGTGKTTLGRELAARLGRPLLDSDEMVEARYGRTVREIWRADGEAVYRSFETEALRDALAGPPAVIAAAGGVVLSEQNREALRASGARVIWLKADPELLVSRTATGEHRPLLDDDPLGALQAMSKSRHDLYAEVATETLEVKDRTPAELADAVLQ
jgi:shikimate kinase